MPDIFTAPKKNTKHWGTSFGLFSAFLEKPKHVHFHGQHNNEIILLLLRRHWVTNMGWLSLGFLLIIAPLVIFPFIDISSLLLIAIPESVFIVAILFWYLGTFGFLILNFLFWYYNVGIVTNERIIDVDFIHLLYNEITGTTIPKIEDITNKRAGFLGVFFDYGNVFLQTAGTEANIEFMAIPKPATVVEIVSKLMEQAHR